MERAKAAARGSILRTAVVFTPLFALSLAGIIAIVVNLALEGPSGFIFTLVLLVVAALLTGYQSVQSLRDLLSTPRETAGTIQRKWTRADLFVLNSYHIYLEGSVYRVDAPIYLEVEPGDTVTIHHYPHTNTVLSVKVERE
jgi:membrane protein implicated in regulation of membrane protease activity